MIRRRLLFIVISVYSGTAVAAEARGGFNLELAPQARYFHQRGFDHQGHSEASLRLSPEYQRDWGSGSFRLVGFGRIDSEDSERTHADLRELFWSHVANLWELHVGVRKIFWGVTEFVHVVDIINQTDLVENIDGEDKLGQPMVHLSFVGDFGIFDLFALTGFRERTFPGKNGRFRPPLVIEDREAEYESSLERAHTDAAVRWFRSAGPLEIGLAHFHGTSREPRLFETTRPNGAQVLAPFYDIIDQSSIDAQAIFGSWALKLEAYSRSGQGDRFYAADAGFERTLVGAFGTRMDLGLVGEYLFDGRGDEAPTIYERDVALGLRVTANDANDTSVLLGWIFDPRTQEYVVRLEGSRRLGARWQANLEAYAFENAHSTSVLNSGFDPDNKSAFLQADDFVQLEIVRFF